MDVIAYIVSIFCCEIITYEDVNRNEPKMEPRGTSQKCLSGNARLRKNGPTARKRTLKSRVSELCCSCESCNTATSVS